MTGDIFNDILGAWNKKLQAQGRSILLLNDNTGCHPRDSQSRFSSIRVVYLPPNTTSRVQPLDLGIIQSTKIHYRKYFLRYVLSKIEECTSAAEVVISVDVLLAIRWISKAWNEVKEETNHRCFKRAGIPDEDLNLLTRVDDIDPFAESDALLQDLITISPCLQANPVLLKNTLMGKAAFQHAKNLIAKHGPLIFWILLLLMGMVR